MRILYVSGYDILGIQVNGYLMHKRIENIVTWSYMYVHAKFSDDDSVSELGGRYISRLNKLLNKVQLYFSLWAFLPVEACSLLWRKRFWQADIVHFQLIHNAQFFSLFMLPLLSWLKLNGKIVLSIHDMFMMTGHCVYPLECERWKTGCGRCPHKDVPFQIKRDTTRLSWFLKRILFRLARIELVAGSKWEADMIRQSPILRHLRVHYLPYAIDTEKYCSKPQSEARARFNIPEDAHVISFRHVPYSVNFKGGEYIREALRKYQPIKKTYLLTIEGIGALEEFEDEFTVIQFPWTNDDQELISDMLNAADVFLMPSIAEAFGFMACEAMACRTPVIVFEGTALPETVNAPSCGVAVPMRDSDALADAIRQMLSDDKYRLEMAARGEAYVKEHHNFEDYVTKHLDLYLRLSKKN